ncbi:hypothetical protein LV83_02683 [Algoriphagus yeomjeoni]|uniref:Uncharacterized protein n=1 Tax=Algoriphagus yeomjeoni TaxID=291403 RepID=A0A327P9J1_9BACT|nr:hypothetical protein LV83_02683 [Algoriphagus yeomjeoni]
MTGNLKGRKITKKIPMVLEIGIKKLPKKEQEFKFLLFDIFS